MQSNTTFNVCAFSSLVVLQAFKKQFFDYPWKSEITSPKIVLKVNTPLIFDSSYSNSCVSKDLIVAQEGSCALMELLLPQMCFQFEYTRESSKPLRSIYVLELVHNICPNINEKNWI